MKNKKVIIILVSVFIVVSLAVLGIYFLTNRNKQNNFNVDSSITKDNSNKSTKISWERNSNIVTDNNFAEEEAVVNTTNVNVKTLTNITLEEFVNKWTESAETNFLCYYNLENKLSKFLTADNIRQGENFSSDRNFYIKGVLPRF